MNTVKIPEILLPANADMHKWAVNACDQYTSDYAYWREVENLTLGSPSAFNLIFPEIYLKDQPEKRISRINETMRAYLSGGVFKRVCGGFILVERTTPSGTRTGIVLSVDLEDYSYEAGAKTLIRSTEATILERIPPRVEIRKNAPVELPHAMLLYDDPQNTVLKAVSRGEVLYDFRLMQNGGRVKGTFITNAEEVTSALYALLDGRREKLLFAVGDGNHSLATAKTCWENLKSSLSEKERENHPARYALVEVVNVYDPALNFQPIHRFVKTDKADLFFSGLKTSGKEFAYIVNGGIKTKIPFSEDIPQGICLLDSFISGFIAKHGGEVDYIHGESDLVNLTDGGVGIILPSISKKDFFNLIISGGNLPRKTFSMGEGYEKRYYIEAKAIKKD